VKVLLQRIPLFLLGMAIVSAEPPGIDQSLEYIVPPSGAQFIQWHGKPGRTYFIQASVSNTPLAKWSWAPHIENGNNEDISYEVDGTANKGFFRLHYTDTPLPAGLTLDAWDADGDGLSNALEISLLHQGNPLNPDTDGDGIPDGWAYAHGLPLNASNASGLFQGGPTTNQQAYQQGVQANPEATIDDHDGDGLDNDADADPQDSDVDWEPAHVGGYVLIELGWPDGVQTQNIDSINDFNDLGHVLLDRHVWRKGQWHPIPVEEASGSETTGGIGLVNYESIDNTGFRLTPSGGILHWGTWHAEEPNGLGSIPYPDHLGHQPYDAETSTYGPFVSTLSTHGLMIDQGLVIPRPLGGDATGRIYADKSYTWNGNPGIWIYNASLEKTGELVLPEDFHLSYSGSHFKKATMTPSGWFAYPAASTPSATNYRALVWNPDGQLITNTDGLPWNFTGFTELPHGKPALACRYDGTGGLVYLLNQNGDDFKTADKLGGKNIHTFAGDGTAMTSDGKMWINGKLTPLRDLCPQYGELVDDGWTLQIQKANQQGTYLVEAHKSGESSPYLLLPVGVLIPKLDSSGNQIDGEFVNANELKVAKWENAFQGTGTNGSVRDDFIAWDKDRFYVRIPGGTAMGVEAVKVATEDCPDASYNDDSTRIELAASGHDSISDSMILVSDEEDDKYAGSGAGADDEDDDRTHKVQLGGNFVIKSIFINGAEHDVNVKIPVPAKKQVDINFYRFDFAGSATEPSIQNTIKWTKERYAQVGLQINDTYNNIGWPDIDGTDGPGKMSIYGDFAVDPSLRQVYYDFIDGVPNAGICIYNVIYAYASAGVAVTMKQIAREEEIELKYINKAFVHSFPHPITGVATANWFTTAHELLHVLAPKLEGDDHDEAFPNILVTPGQNIHVDHRSRKRINSEQQKRIYEHLNVEDL
jgi:hypothetical protein